MATLPTSLGGRWVARSLAGVVVLAVAGGLYADHHRDYRVQVALESATNVVKGAPVLVDGFDSGKVADIRVEDGHALVTLALDKEVAPLHDGATVVIGWKAALSERLVEVTDGPAGHPAVPDGGQLPGTMAAPTEVSDILNALDAPTRRHLQSLLAEAGQTLHGNESNLDATISNGGPTLGQLGQLLTALGTDGPAMKDLVRRVDAMMTTVSGRDDKVGQVVDTLSRLTHQVARRRTSLRAGLAALPGTLHQARTTLDHVPSTVAAVDPLLRDLTPATARLGSVSRDLAPLLRDLRPAASDLRPTLGSARRLLGVTPTLLDTFGATSPEITSILASAKDPVAFARPYTPEITGFLSDWASAFADYDSNGNFARIHGQAGLTSLDENPGVVPPGVVNDPYPQPGAIVGQPWTDAYGSEME